MTWVRTRTRPKYLIPFAILAGLLVFLGLALTGSQPVAEQPEMLGPLPQAVNFSNQKGVFETALVAMEAPVDLGNGVTAIAQTFNGMVPGPEIRLKVGDKVIVHFTNNLLIPSSIHWHGIELTNRSDGTGITQVPVQPGGTFTYDFIVPRPGIFFFHSHIDPTNPTFKGFYGSLIVEDPAEKQLIAKKVLPKTKNTLTLIVGDTTVCKAMGSNDAATFPPDPTLPWAGVGPFPGKSASPSPADLCENPLDSMGHFAGTGALAAGTIPNVQPTHECGGGGEPGCPTNEGQLVLTNGKVTAPRAGSPDAPGLLSPGPNVIDVKSGEGIRLQVASATAIRYLRLRLTCPTSAPCVPGRSDNQIPLFRVGGQGGLLDNARLEGGVQDMLDTLYAEGEILIGVSERQDLVFRVPNVPKEGGVVTLWTLDYKRTGGGQGNNGFSALPTVPIAHFRLQKGSGDEDSKFQIAAGDPIRTHPKINMPVESLKAAVITDHYLDPATFTPPELGTPNETITLTTTGKPGIDSSQDGFIYDAGPTPPDTVDDVPHVGSSRWTAVGHLLELTLKNMSSAHHPWHPHGFSIQPVRFVDNTTNATVREFTHNEFVDSIDIPPGTSLVYRVRIDDRPFDFATPGGGAVGRWAMHCHILFHAGIGMITEFVVKATP